MDKKIDPIQHTHSLTRTSPIGEAFVGRCILCGAEGLASSDALKPCANPLKTTFFEALDETIMEPTDGH